MFSKQLLFAAILLVLFNGIISAGEVKKGIDFNDDFEKGTVKWDLVNPDKIEIIDTGDPKHGKALCLYPGGEAVYALIKGSDDWTNLKIEGDLFFPAYTCSYLGFIYNYNVRGPRTDFGSIFILGPFGEDLIPYYTNYGKYMQWPPDNFLGNIVWVNPHRASNASRNIYGEYWVTLTDEAAVIKPGQWGRFKAEIVGPACHFYVRDMEKPVVTYDFFEFSSGRVGFKPRFTGAEVLVDNITVTSINEFSYKGPDLPAGNIYKPGELLTRWETVGAFTRRIKELEEEGYVAGKSYKNNNKTYKWTPYKADPRGCMDIGTLTNRFKYEFFVYLHTEIISESQKDVVFEFSTTNSLVLWVNNERVGNAKKELMCMHDFRKNPNFGGSKIKATLKPGKNSIMVLSRGGNYGGDGFYAYCDMEPPADAENKK